jgi:regulator of replication initiation timing
MTAKEEMMMKILAEAKQGEAKQFYEDGTHQMGSVYNEGFHPDNYFFLKEELISIGLSKYEENFENYSF